jgi:hypothetical protein
MGDVDRARGVVHVAVVVGTLGEIFPPEAPPIYGY